ncbi:MAG: L,D-transpeptidase family protein [Gemmatimonadaceae bacterium]|nr:L,D-transpeptidase family protein [Gemmatimonadaceae bacterium]
MKQPRFVRARAWIAATVRRDASISRIIGCAALTLAVLSPLRVRALPPGAVHDSLVAASIADIAARGDLGSLHSAELRADVSRLYTRRAWAPLWSTDGTVTPAALATVASLTRIEERGLVASDYDVARLSQLARRPLSSAAERAEFDMTLSVATLRALRDLYFGRVNAWDVHPTLHIARESVDLAATVTQLIESGTPDSSLDAAEPQTAEYQRLKRALAVYRARNSLQDSVAQARITQIELTLERWRWLPRTFDVPPVIVNIPAYHLDVLAADGAPSSLSMNVVVGSTKGHQTPIIADTIRFVEFAPYWIVPLSIAKAELLPMAMRDPHILTVNNYEVVDRRGRVVVPTVRALKQVLAGTSFIRQLPGGSNSLGRVKFLFPNVYDVYLHDSPVQGDFKRIRRDQSHGCIRVADPRGFAVWLLREQPEWTSARIDRAMSARTSTRVPLSRGVPVYLFYATAVAGEDGGVQFHSDIYGYDAVLAVQLARRNASRTAVAEAADLASPRQ